MKVARRKLCLVAVLSLSLASFALAGLCVTLRAHGGSKNNLEKVFLSSAETQLKGGKSRQSSVKEARISPRDSSPNSSTEVDTGAANNRRPFEIKTAESSSATFLSHTGRYNTFPGLAATIIVTNTNDSGTGSLRQAISDAASGDTINFSVPYGSIITLTSAELLINKSLTIGGPGVGSLTVQRATASGTPQFRIFHIASGNFDVTISGLTVSNGNATTGGGIEDDSVGNVTIANCAISGNIASSLGGGILNNGTGTINITNCRVMGNSTGQTGQGGGILNAFGIANITGCAVTNNSAIDGGGIDSGVSSSFTTTVITNVRNSTIFGNSATAGGGVFSGGSSNTTATFTNCTIVGNYVNNGSGGGIRNFSAFAPATVNLKNTIVAGNSSPTAPDITDGVISQGYNLIGDSSGATVTPQSTDQIGTSFAPINPMVGPLVYNGGPTQTLALLPGSPAIDKGAPATGVMTDQRGFPRPIDDPNILNSSGGDGSDIGAFEAVSASAQANLSVTVVDSPDPVALGSNVMYTVSATNLGPNMATGVLLSDALPNGVELVSASCTGGTLTTQVGGIQTYNIPFTRTPDLFPYDLPLEEPGNAVSQNYLAAAHTTPTDFRFQSTRVFYTTRTLDDAISIYENYFSSHGWTLLAQLSIDNLRGRSYGKDGTQFQVDANENTVTHLRNVSLIFTSNGLVWTSAGMPSGATATITLITRPSVNGIINNVATVYGNELDPALISNTTTESTTVGNATPTPTPTPSPSPTPTPSPSPTPSALPSPSPSPSPSLSPTPTPGPSTDTITYTYDALNRLTNVSYGSGGSIVYSYDAAGNRTAIQATGASTPTPTGTGTNVTVQADALSITFATVTSAGTTTITPINSSSAGNLPNGYQLFGGSLAFDVATTASTQGSIGVCFNITAFFDQTTFSQLRILHNENGQLVDRTGGADFNSKMICSSASSLGQFVLAITPNPQMQFNATDYGANEGDLSVLIKVSRLGDTSGTAMIDYATVDGTARQRTDYITAAGTLTFAPGEMNKDITVLLVNNTYVDGNRIVNLNLSNPAGAPLGTPASVVLTIQDNDNVQPTTNPLDDVNQRFFVRQHYYDFLSRLPDQDGLDYWVGQITQCGTNQTCINNRRLDISNAFFYELEYQQTAAYVFRLYRAAFGNNQPLPNPDNSDQTEARKIPNYSVFSHDRARLIGSANLAQDQLALANAFVQRSEFLNKYPNSLNAEQFVDALLANITNDSNANLVTQREALVAQYNQGGRGMVLYRVADDNLQTNPINNRAFIDAEYNRAFVASQYFGYLKRDPDIGGFLFWLGQVSNAPLRNVPKQHAMVCSFITSTEYQQRFSSVVTHSNGECPH